MRMRSRAVVRWVGGSVVVMGAVLGATRDARAQQARPDDVRVQIDSGAASVPVLANDDAGTPGSRLAILSTTPPSHGTLTVAPGGTGVVYTPAAGFVGSDSFTYTASNTFQVVDVPRQTLATVTGTAIYEGFGSAVAPVPGTTDEFYVMTDRGPNVDGPNGGKVFALGTFTPQIGRYKLASGAVTAVGSPILLRDAAGQPRTGLPNPAGAGGTGEIAYDNAGNVLAADPNGIDSEGLVALADGTFWVSDEYGPYMVHFAADGTTIEQLAPYALNAQGHKLPACLQFRIVNKGMEGLTITPDGKRLVGNMQSPLANAITESDAGKSSALRIVTFDLVTDATHTAGATHQYLYLLDDPKFTCSEITAVSNTEFLIDERDGKFPADPAGAATQKKVYRISLAGATDVNDPADTTNGLLYGGKSIEALVSKLAPGPCRTTLAANGITPVAKILAVDLLAQTDAVGMLGTLYPHDKVEGIALVDGGRRLLFSNDDDFGVTAGATTFSVVEKTIPTLTPARADFTQLLFVDLLNLSSAPVTATVTVEVEGPRGVLENVAAELSALQAQVSDKKDAGRLAQVVRTITPAVDPSLFTDELHAGAQFDKVFVGVGGAVKKLRTAIGAKKTTLDRATLQGFADTAVWAARLLATTEIADAAATADLKALAKANAEIVKGDAAAQSGHGDLAIAHYRKACRAVR